MSDEELRATARWLREASVATAGPALLRLAMADVIDMAVAHRVDGDCYLCETDMKGECVAWCNGVILAMAARRV